LIENKGIKAMQAEMKPIMIIMVIILLTGQLLGDIKATGKLLIPTAKGNKPYNAVIIITRAVVRIECEKKIFKPFNEFDAPKQARLKVNTAEIYKIQISKKKNEILLIAKDSLYLRYRHIFHPVWRVVQFIPFKQERKEAMIFIMDNHSDLGCIEEDLKKLINERKRKKPGK
jgi:hypothetical protein